MNFFVSEDNGSEIELLQFQRLILSFLEAYDIIYTAINKKLIAVEQRGVNMLVAIIALAFFEIRVLQIRNLSGSCPLWMAPRLGALTRSYRVWSTSELNLKRELLPPVLFLHLQPHANSADSTYNVN